MNQCIVTLDANKGTLPGGDIVITHNDFIHHSASYTPTMSDRQFTGRCILGRTKVETSGAWATMGTVTLRDKWIYIMTFYAGDGKLVEDTAVLVMHGLLFMYTQYATRDGYKFIGWFTAKNDGTGIVSGKDRGH